MEFSAPGVQSRDRSWKKHYFILRGTALFVYKFDPHRFPLKTENPLVPTTTEEESEEHLHVHLPGERRASLTTNVNGAGSAPRRASLDNSSGNAAATGTGSRRGSISTALSNIATETRRGSLPGPSPLSAGADHARRPSNASATPSTSTATSGSDAKDTALFNSSPRKASVSSSINSASSQSTSIASHFQQNQLVKVYTLQNAESGLAADYVKRKNVVRVRSEGEQFLLQTDSARDVVDWIEVSRHDGFRSSRCRADSVVRHSSRLLMLRLTSTTGLCPRSSRFLDDVAVVYPVPLVLLVPPAPRPRRR